MLNPWRQPGVSIVLNTKGELRLRDNYTIMDMFVDEMRKARTNALILYKLDPKHELIPLLEGSKDGEAHWDALCDLAYKKYHSQEDNATDVAQENRKLKVKLDLSTMKGQLMLWKEITGLLSDAVEEARAKARKQIEEETSSLLAA